MNCEIFVHFCASLISIIDRDGIKFSVSFDPLRGEFNKQTYEN